MKATRENHNSFVPPDMFKSDGMRKIRIPSQPYKLIRIGRLTINPKVTWHHSELLFTYGWQHIGSGCVCVRARVCVHMCTHLHVLGVGKR